MAVLSLLIIVPQVEELQPLLDSYRAHGFTTSLTAIGRIECFRIDSLATVIAVGGHGKTQLALQTQHLVDRCPELSAVVCAGGAGTLSEDLRFGDVVVGTCSVEHDYKLRFVRRPLPRFAADNGHIDAFRNAAKDRHFRFRVHFGAIASGDEDIVDPVRSRQLRDDTGALCAAWEGSGAARVAAFNGLKFVEVRTITDGADSNSAVDFHVNLKLTIPNITDVIGQVASQSNRFSIAREPSGKVAGLPGSEE